MESFHGTHLPLYEHNVAYPHSFPTDKQPSRESVKKLRRKIVYAFLEATSLHGLGRIFTSRTKCLRLMWFLVFIAGFLYVSYGIYDSIKTYYSYPSTTKIRTVFEDKVTFPAVTFCNRNKYMKSRAMKKYPKLVQYYEKKKGMTSKKVNISSEQMETIFDDIGGTLEDTMVKCKWSTNSCPKGSFTKIVVENFGNCFTFNSGKDGQSVLNISSAGRYFGVYLLLNMHVGEYLPAYSAGATIVVHDQDEPVNLAHRGVAAAPGEETMIAVTKSKMTSLEAPYETACKNLQVKGYKRYTKAACLEHCFYKYIFKHCGCMKEGFIGPAKMCSFRDRVNCVVRYQLKFRLEVAQHCGCPHPCETILYSTSVSQYAWPTDSYVKNYGHYVRKPNMTNKEVKAYYKKNFVLVRVYLRSMHYDLTQEVPTYSSFNLFADIGGLVGLFLGASILTFFEFCELLIDLCYPERKKPKDRDVMMEWMNGEPR